MMTLSILFLLLFRLQRMIEESNGLSHAEVDFACRDAIKQAILTDKQKVDANLLSQMLGERQSTHRRE